MEICRKCNGRGEITCPDCNGDGKDERDVCYSDDYRWRECYRCNGRGTITCPDCNGKGMVDD